MVSEDIVLQKDGTFFLSNNGSLSASLPDAIDETFFKQKTF
jgi:hypothetical protein